MKLARARACVCIYNNNDNLFYLQVAKFPSRLRFKANLSSERSQLYRMQPRSDESNLYREDCPCGKCLINKICFEVFSKR